MSNTCQEGRRSETKHLSDSESSAWAVGEESAVLRHLVVVVVVDVLGVIDCQYCCFAKMVHR